MVRRWILPTTGPLLVVLGAPGFAQSLLKIIEPPGGGRIVYGTVDGQSTEAGAMGAILRNLHSQYGDKPQVGRAFRVKETHSAAVLFTLVKRTQYAGHIAGLIIVAPAGAGRVEAALLSDEAPRFGSTVNPMLKTLLSVWHSVGERSAPSSVTAARGPLPELKKHVLPDNSAAVSLPDGWRILPRSGGGSNFVEGPGEEAVALNFVLLAMNSSDPRVRQTMAFAQGAGRNTSYARTIYHPYGGDLATTFSDVIQQNARMNNQPAMNIRIEKQIATSAGPASRCALIEGQLDPNDGKGPRQFSTLFCQGPKSGTSYMNIVFHSAAPVATASRNAALRGAIMDSFQINNAVVERQAAAIAAPVTEQIHAIGRAAAAQAAASHAASDRLSQSVQDRWNSQDRQSQAFSSYLLDQTVISDNQRGEHTTAWNNTAEAMVHSNPERYGYVETPNFWKGVDY